MIYVRVEDVAYIGHYSMCEYDIYNAHRILPISNKNWVTIQVGPFLLASRQMSKASHDKWFAHRHEMVLCSRRERSWLSARLARSDAVRAPLLVRKLLLQKPFAVLRCEVFNHPQTPFVRGWPTISLGTRNKIVCPFQRNRRGILRNNTFYSMRKSSNQKAKRTRKSLSTCSAHVPQLIVSPSRPNGHEKSRNTQTHENDGQPTSRNSKKPRKNWYKWNL